MKLTHVRYLLTLYPIDSLDDVKNFSIARFAHSGRRLVILSERQKLWFAQVEEAHVAISRANTVQERHWTSPQRAAAPRPTTDRAVPSPQPVIAL